MDNTLDEVVDAGDREAAEKPPRWLEVWLPTVIVAADQGTKALIRATLPLHSSRTIVPGLVDFTHVLNSGAAFGFLNGVDFPFKTVVIAVIATAALIGVGMYAASLAHHQLIARLGLALIIGGAARNLIALVLDGPAAAFAAFSCHGYHFWPFTVSAPGLSIAL